MVTSPGLLSGANAKALRVSPFNPTGRGAGFAVVFAGRGAVGDGLGGLLVVVRAADVVVVVEEVVVGVGVGVTEGVAGVVAAVRRGGSEVVQPPSTRAARQSQRVCRMGTEGSLRRLSAL